jgi:hypothetical protein
MLHNMSIITCSLGIEIPHPFSDMYLLLVYLLLKRDKQRRTVGIHRYTLNHLVQPYIFKNLILVIGCWELTTMRKLKVIKLKQL